MFNLNVVYMMYDPEHWCQVCSGCTHSVIPLAIRKCSTNPSVQVPGFDDPNDTSVYEWGLNDVQNISFVFPNEAGRSGAYIRDSVSVR